MRSISPFRLAVLAPQLLAGAFGIAIPATVALAAPATPLAATTPRRLVLQPCTVPGLDREVRCGTFEVFEDRAAGRGRMIPLRVVVLPATGQERAPDPVFLFAGGPGESAVKQAPGIAQGWADLNRKRDVVLVDVRGTGASNGLQCTALQGDQGMLGFLESFLPVPGVRACRQEIEARADLRLYTTAPAIDDVDDVRAGLGYDRINVTGGSYGSYASLTYLRRHGEHVRTIAIDAVVPPHTRMPLFFARDAQLAFDQVGKACGEDAACHAAFPDPAGDLKRALARLEREPAHVEAHDPRTGKAVAFELSRSAAAQTVRYMLYLPLTAAQIPLQLHLAAAQNFTPLGETAYMFANMMGTISDGYYLSVTCAEDVPFFDVDEAAKAAEGAFLGSFRARSQKEACAEWPRGPVPADLDEPVRSEVPALLVSGERDPVTPAYGAEQVARTLPHALHLVVRGGGHGFDGLAGAECIDRVFAEFVERGSEKGLDTGCLASIMPVPFALRDERAPRSASPMPSSIASQAPTRAKAAGRSWCGAPKAGCKRSSARASPPRSPR